MRFAKLSLLVVALCTSAAVAQAAMGKCLLQVDGRNYIKGLCEIEIIDKQGSFTIGASDKSRSPYFAYVIVTSPGVADASWNEDPKSTHAHTSLGILKRQGACWVNKTARMCARK